VIQHIHRSTVFITGLFVASLLGFAVGPSPLQAFDVDAMGNPAFTSIADFEACEQRSGYMGGCTEGLEKLTKAHPETAFAAGKLLLRVAHHSLALPVFVRGLDAASPEQCADPDLARAVIAGLSLPVADALVPVAAKAAIGRCWAGLQPKLLTELREGTRLYRTNTCPVLAKKALHPAECTEKPATTAATPPRSAKLASLNLRALTVDPSSLLVFRAEQAEEIVVVRAKAPHSDVLLVRAQNVTGPWNNVVIPALEKVQGQERDYIAHVDGQDWILMTASYRYAAVYLKGYADGLRVARDSPTDEQKTAIAQDLTKALQASPIAVPKK
jgi:hypothetical protein